MQSQRIRYVTWAFPGLRTATGAGIGWPPRWPHCRKLTGRQGRQPPLLRATESLLPVARAMCDRLAALDGLGLPPAAATCRSTPSSPNAYRAVVQQQQLEKTASVPDLPQQKRQGGGDERASEDDGPSVAATATEQRAAPASACGADSKSEGCLTESGRLPVTSLSGTFLTPVTKVSLNLAKNLAMVFTI